MKLAARMAGLQGRRTSAWDIHYAAQQAREQGEDVIILSVGDPDFATPEVIVESAIDALRAGDTHYTEVVGRAPLRAAIARHYAAAHAVAVGEDNVIVLAGAQNGLFAVSQCLLEAGDEVIVPDPMYLTYEASVRAAGATLVPVPVDPARGFRLDHDALERAITPRTRAIFFATPCNPTGVVMSRDDLRLIARLADAHDLWVLSDEVYADLVFEGEHVSIASLPGMARRTLTLGSLSKSHAMPGWRLGWAIGPRELIGHLERLALCMLYGLPGFIQQAALTAFEHRHPIVDDMREVYRQRRALVHARLRDVPGLRCLLPDAGMFMMMDVRGTGLTANDFAWRLLREQGVSVLDASAFGDAAEGFVRIGFVVQEARLEAACERIAALAGSLMQGGGVALNA